MKTTLTFLIVFYFAITSILAQTTISGGDVYGTWTADNSPYLIEGDISVPADSLLVVEPGVSVEFRGAYIFIINGLIDCQGTETDSIFFYSGTVPGYRGTKIMTDTLVQDSMIFTYCRFEGARCSGEWPYNCGGGLGVWDFDRVRVEHCLFKNNRAWTGSQAAGGAISTATSDLIIRNNTFIDNRSLYGGAMIIWERSNAVISYNHFENNRASYEGGAIIIWGDSHGPVHHNTFVGNRANGEGAAISFYDHCNNLLHHNLFYDNNAIKKGGAVYMQLSCAPVFLNNTFVDNNADVSGGAIHNQQGSCPRMVNNILWGNTSPYGSQFCNDDTTCIPDFFNNDIQWGQGFIPGFHDLCEWKANIDAYPQFEDTLVDNFNLTAGSPCLDAGVDSILDPDGTISDLGAFWLLQTGMEEAIGSDIQLSVYPNPVETIFTVNCRLPLTGYRDCQLSIFDINGRLIDQLQFRNNEAVYDASHLPDGLYLLSLRTENQRTTIKLLKK